jgi:hypothetical protein
VLSVLVVVIAVRSVEATVRSATSAVPVSWLLCDELPASVSDAIGRGAEAHELTDDTCSFLSGWAATRWDDDDNDDD